MRTVSSRRLEGSSPSIELRKGQIPNLGMLKATFLGEINNDFLYWFVPPCLLYWIFMIQNAIEINFRMYFESWRSDTYRQNWWRENKLISEKRSQRIKSGLQMVYNRLIPICWKRCWIHIRTKFISFGETLLRDIWIWRFH